MSVSAAAPPVTAFPADVRPFVLPLLIFGSAVQAEVPLHVLIPNPPITADSARAGAGKTVCRRVAVTGSVALERKTCKTAAAWAKEAGLRQDEIDRLQNRASINACGLQDRTKC